MGKIFQKIKSHPIISFLVTLTIPGIIILLFNFTTRDYSYGFKKGLLKITSVKCREIRPLNHVWECSLKMVNSSDSKIDEREHDLASTPKNLYHFTDCLVSSKTGVKVIPQDNEYICRYMISIDGVSEKMIKIQISASEKEPQFILEEVN